MDWKIKEISIRNFKYTHDLFSLDIDCKNLLLYGENGCGKSTIYWALYTLYQSYFKESNAAVEKYFDINNNQNLLNRYHNSPADFLLSVIYKNDAGASKQLELSPTNTDIIRSGDSFVQNTATFSDFINYKILSSFFDFRNSDEANIFPFIEKDLFPLLDLNEKCTHIDGTQTTVTSYAGEWWSYMKSVPDTLPSHENGQIQTDTLQYVTYLDIITDFNERLKDKLNQLQEDTNQLLQDRFGINDTKIEFEYQDATFNKPLKRYSGILDGELHNPKILIKAKVERGIILTDDNKVIMHPKTFFNEAQLTRIAFAIRLALFEERSNSTTPDSNALICLDDMLISLDMANRMKVIELLLEYSKEYQMIIMTHDRSFYSLLQMEINRNGLSNKWVYKNMYIPEGTANYAQIPKLTILDEKNNIQKAEKFITEYDYAAAATCLRKECESVLCKLYFQNEILKPESDGTCQKLNLNSLMDKLPKFYDVYELPNNLTPHLNSYRKAILNPMSHADIDTPFFREEIHACKDEIITLKSMSKQYFVIMRT